MPDKEPKQVRLPSVDAEYTYLRRLVCDTCGGPTSHTRYRMFAQEREWWRTHGTMIDYWLNLHKGT